jgi:hypothetical protein
MHALGYLVLMPTRPSHTHNVMSARAIEHSIGAAIINNGAKGGYVFRAAKYRLAGIQPFEPWSDSC